jgi:hypothetical protein
MSDESPRQSLPEAQSLAQLPLKILEEVIRQLRSTRNDIIRFGVWNIRNITDDEFNKTDDRKLLGYFRQDLLETRFLSKGRRIDIVQLWRWFDDQMSGVEPLLVDKREVFLNVQDKDLDKVRKRIEEIQSFLPAQRRPRWLPAREVQAPPHRHAPDLRPPPCIQAPRKAPQEHLHDQRRPPHRAGPPATGGGGRDPRAAHGRGSRGSRRLTSVDFVDQVDLVDRPRKSTASTKSTKSTTRLVLRSPR